MRVSSVVIFLAVAAVCLACAFGVAAGARKDRGRISTQHRYFCLPLCSTCLVEAFRALCPAERGRVWVSHGCLGVVSCFAFVFRYWDAAGVGGLAKRPSFVCCH